MWCEGQWSRLLTSLQQPKDLLDKCEGHSCDQNKLNPCTEEALKIPLPPLAASKKRLTK